MGRGLHAETGRERFMLGKYLSDKKIPSRRRIRLEMAVAEITPTAQNRQDALSSRVSAVQESETCFVDVLYD